MKRNELKEIKLKDPKELKVMLVDLKKEIAKLIVERASGKTKNVALIGQKRKDVARILTIIRQKELSEI